MLTSLPPPATWPMDNAADQALHRLTSITAQTTRPPGVLYQAASINGLQDTFVLRASRAHAILALACCQGTITFCNHSFGLVGPGSSTPLQVNCRVGIPLITLHIALFLNIKLLLLEGLFQVPSTDAASLARRRGQNDGTHGSNNSKRSKCAYGFHRNLLAAHHSGNLETWQPSET